MKNVFRICSYFLLLFSAVPVSAFQISTLSKIINNDVEYLTLTGELEREYIYTTLSQVMVDKNGEINEVPMNPEKVAEWPVLVEPGEIVLGKGEEVRVRISRNETKLHDDIVMGLSFIPEKTTQGLEKQASGLQMAVGYKAWLFISGTTPLTGDVTAYKEGGRIIVNNKTNKILRVVISNCLQQSNQSCNGSFISLPGVKKVFDIQTEKLSLDILMIDKEQKKVKALTL